MLGVPVIMNCPEPTVFVEVIVPSLVFVDNVKPTPATSA